MVVCLQNEQIAPKVIICASKVTMGASKVTMGASKVTIYGSKEQFPCPTTCYKSYSIRNSLTEPY
jgi:hypothetical protein